MGTPFISRTDLSNYLGRDVSADDGATIATDSACEMVRTLAEQRFDEVSGETISLDGSGTDSLLLPELPVNTVGTVTVNGGTVTDYCLADNGILYRGTAGSRYSWPHCWPAGRQNVTVTYDHGYSEVPEDIRMVALAVASRLVVQGPASFEVLGDQQVRYGVNSTDFTNGEKMIIQKYRRHH